MAGEYIKFNYELVKSDKIKLDSIKELNDLRNKLYEMGFIGMFKSGEFAGAGFGNVSIRSESGFIITGSGTGTKPKITEKDYVEVIDYDFEKNWLKCFGLTPPSFESLTHAAVYESNKKINAVIHAHNLELWKKLLKNNTPKTPEHIGSGTSEIVDEIKRLIKEEKGIIVMGGHEEGMLIFGSTLDEAWRILLQYFEK
ncbi:class II aldolase/adducin family protein [Candidatus Aenigmatarchaeota archaeon]